MNVPWHPPATPLLVELVPSSSWGSNLRSVLKRGEWDKLRNQVYIHAGNCCEVCHVEPPKGALHAHEIWSFDGPRGIQRLDGIAALCSDCHMVKHFGWAQERGLGERALAHLGQVNGWSRGRCLSHLDEAFSTWRQRSTRKWALDLRSLEGYGCRVPAPSAGLGE